MTCLNNPSQRCHNGVICSQHGCQRVGYREHKVTPTPKSTETTLPENFKLVNQRVSFERAEELHREEFKKYSLTTEKDFLTWLKHSYDLIEK